MPLYVNPNTSFYDKSFKSTGFQSCVLNLHFGMHGVNLAVYHTEKNKFIGFESFRIVGIKNPVEIADEIESLVSERSWLTDDFDKVNVVYSNTQSTLIPNALFNEEEKDLYLNFNHPRQKDSTTAFNSLKNTGSVVVFELPVKLEQKIKTIWPKVSMLHSSSVYIESVLMNFRNKATDNMLFVQLDQGYFDILYLKNNKLFFHNAYVVKTKEDFIYFLLSAIEKLELNPEIADVVLSGFIDKNSIYYEMVLQYIRNNSFIERNSTFNYSFVLDNLKHHKHYVLFNALQCE